MLIKGNKDVCAGAGMCALMAPEVFTQSEDDGTVEVLDPHPSEDRYALVRRVVPLCPAGAISVIE